MSAAAVIRSAGRAFRRPREFITSRRRLYSSDYIGNTPKLNKGDYPGHDGNSSIISESVAERMCRKLDKMIASCDRQAIRFKQIEENMREDHERLLKARGRRVLFGTAAIIIGIAVYVNQ